MAKAKAVKENPPEELERKELTMLAKADTLKVSTEIQYKSAMDVLKEIKALQKEIGDTFLPICEKAHAAWKEALAQKAKHLKPLEDAERIIKGKANTFLTAQEEIRAHLQREASSKAEAEAKAERDAEAKRLQADGQRKAAAAVRAAPLEINPIEIAPLNTAVEGVSRRKVFTFKITDASLIPREYLVIDESKIRKVVNALGLETKIPGVQVFQDSQIAVKA